MSDAVKQFWVIIHSLQLNFIIQMYFLIISVEIAIDIKKISNSNEVPVRRSHMKVPSTAGAERWDGINSTATAEDT